MKNCYPFSADESFRPIFNLPNWFSGDNLWYLQMYGIFILVVLPILKLFEDKLTQKVHLCLILALFFPNFLGFILHLPGIWLFNKIEHIIMCYYLGGYVSKYKVRISMWKLLAAFAAYLVFYFVFDYIWRYSCAVTYQPLQYSFTDVMQPTICVVTYSFLVFMIAVNIAGPSGFMSKALESLSSSTIGIYIFHSEFLSISFILAETFWWKDWSQKGYFLFILINSFFLLLAGHLIDIFRRLSYEKIEAALVDLFSRVE